MILLFYYLIELNEFNCILLMFLYMLFHKKNNGNFLFTEIGLKTLHCVIR